MKRGKTTELLAAALVLVGASAFAVARMAPSDVRTIPYQGALEQDGAAANGDYLMRFGLFVTPPDANAAQCVANDNCALWSEEQLVTVTNGHFSVLLGDSDGDVTDQLLANNTLFLVMAVKPAADPGPFVLLSGAQEIIPQAWAARAAGASTFRVTSTLTVDGAASLTNVNVSGTTTTADLAVTDDLTVTDLASLQKVEVNAAGYLDLNGADIDAAGRVQAVDVDASGSVKAGFVDSSGQVRAATLQVTGGLPITLSGDFTDNNGLLITNRTLVNTTRSVCFLLRSDGQCIVSVVGANWNLLTGINSTCTARCISW